MSRTSLLRIGALSAWALAGGSNAAAASLFDPWNAYAYAQGLALDRPQGLPPAGDLDNNSHQSAGLNHDGLFVQKLEVKLWGPLGPDGWAATMGTQTDLVSTGLTDAYVEWVSASKAWSLKLGQERLPFGAEEQSSSARLLGVQRSLAYGFANYGHIDTWGLGVLNERGDGLRADYDAALASRLHLVLQSAAMAVAGNSFNTAAAVAGRAALRWGNAPWGLELGASGHASRANLEVASTHYQPLGSEGLDPSTWAVGSGDGGKATVLTWGQDARLDLGLLHLGAEAVFQSLGSLTRGGGKGSAACDLPWGSGRPLYVYGSEDQASSNFGDGVHQPGALYRARTLGLFCPLPWHSGLKIEDLLISVEGLPGSFPDGQIYQAQWQIEL
jgi:hypothetical protein